MKRSDSEGSSRPGLRVREREGERVSVSVTAGSGALHREPVDPSFRLGRSARAWPPGAGLTERALRVSHERALLRGGSA